MTIQGVDSIAQFAADLRALRRAAGDPILDVMARRCGIGRTVLSNAFRGQSLPTKNTVVAIVAMLGDDQDQWIQRWMRLRVAGLVPSSGGTDAAEVPVVAEARVPIRSWWTTVIIGFVCLAIGFGGGVLVPHLTSSPSAQAATVATGADPWAEPACQADAVRVGFATRAEHYLVEVLRSQACQGVWGQVTRFDGQHAGNSLTVSVYLPYEAASAQTTTGPDVQTVHSPLLVQPSRARTICVNGAAQIGSYSVDLSPPVCVDYR